MFMGVKVPEKKSGNLFDRFGAGRVYLCAATKIDRAKGGCSSYGLLGVRSHEAPRRGRLTCFRGSLLEYLPKIFYCNVMEITPFPKQWNKRLGSTD